MLALRPAAAAAPVGRFELDVWLIVVCMLLLALGLTMVTSASMPIAEHNGGHPFYYLLRQVFHIAFAIVVAAAIFRVPSERWFSCHLWLLLAAIALLILVLLVGKKVNGSTRWLNFGIINIQVSELAKLIVLVYIAGYLQRYRRQLQTSTLAMVRPLIVLAGLAFLLLLEPDFGAAAVLFATALGVMFLAGVNVWRFALVLLASAAALAMLVLWSDYRRQRLVSFLDPWDDPFGNGFQLVQSLIAIGRGELFGVGLGASIQKLFYLPEAYTDFLFAILAEELGLVGVLLVIALYAILVWRSFRIAAHAERLERWFGAYLAYGVGLLFAIQALVNMGVNMGVLPTKGLTLPLLSYGGSSSMVMAMAVAILLRVDWENQRDDPRLQRQRRNTATQSLESDTEGRIND